MDPSAIICAKTRDFLSQEIREAYPYMKTATLDALIQEAVSGIEQRIGASQPEQTAAKARSGFFTLPAELRNRIYELHLGLEESQEFVLAVRRVSRAQSTGNKIPQGLRLPPIIRSSSAVRNETLALYYSNKLFTWTFDNRTLPLGDLNPLIRWLDSLGLAQTAMINRLTIKIERRGADLERVVRRIFEKQESVEYRADMFVGDFLRALGLGRYGIRCIILEHLDSQWNWIQRQEGLLNEPFSNSGLPDEVFDQQQEVS